MPAVPVMVLSALLSATFAPAPGPVHSDVDHVNSRLAEDPHRTYRWLPLPQVGTSSTCYVWEGADDGSWVVRSGQLADARTYVVRSSGAKELVGTPEIPWVGSATVGRGGHVAGLLAKPFIDSVMPTLIMRWNPDGSKEVAPALPLIGDHEQTLVAKVEDQGDVILIGLVPQQNRAHLYRWAVDGSLTHLVSVEGQAYAGMAGGGIVMRHVKWPEAGSAWWRPSSTGAWTSHTMGYDVFSLSPDGRYFIAGTKTTAPDGRPQWSFGYGKGLGHEPNWTAVNEGATNYPHAINNRGHVLVGGASGEKVIIAGQEVDVRERARRVPAGGTLAVGTTIDTAGRIGATVTLNGQCRAGILAPDVAD